MQENSTEITFISKRNTVRGDGEIVKKLFKNTEDFEREKAMIALLQSKKVAVPSLVSTSENMLCYKHIDGILYSELVENMEEKHAIALAEWLLEYHKATGKLRVDNNLRNYIFSEKDEICVGIDFESHISEGDIAEDCGKIIAFAATYNPSFTDWKKRTCALLIRTFTMRGICGKRIEEMYKLEISEMCKRRRTEEDMLERATAFYAEVKEELFWNSDTKEELEVKNLAYSRAQLFSFFDEMDGVYSLAEDLFAFKDIRLSVTEIGADNRFNIPITRSELKMIGSFQIREEFYRRFLVNHMTMGG